MSESASVPSSTPAESSAPSATQKLLGDDLSGADISQLVQELSPEDLATLDESQVESLVRKLNPFGNVTNQEGCVNLSIVNFREQDLKNMITIGIAAYLARACDEWNLPDGMLVVPVDEWVKNPSLLDTPKTVLESKNETLIAAYEENRRIMREERLLLRRFIERNFQYNPREHVRSSYTPNPLDPNRADIQSNSARLARAELRERDPEFRQNEIVANIGKPMVKITRKIRGKNGEVREITRDVPEADVQPLIDSGLWKMVGRVATQPGVDPTLAGTMAELIPPADHFARFNTYYTLNYDQIRKVCTDLFNLNPNFHMAIQPLSMHTGVVDGKSPEEQAAAFRHAHASHFITEVLCLRAGVWNIFEPTKEVRDTQDVSGDKNSLLSSMLKQAESDNQIASSILKKRSFMAKAKNRAEQGEDSPAFRAWMKNNPQIQSTSAKNLGDVEQDEEIVDGDMTVPVWRATKYGQLERRDIPIEAASTSEISAAAAAAAAASK